KQASLPVPFPVHHAETDETHPAPEAARLPDRCFFWNPCPFGPFHAVLFARKMDGKARLVLSRRRRRCLAYVCSLYSRPAFWLLVADRIRPRIVRQESRDLPPPRRGELPDRGLGDGDAVHRVRLRFDPRIVRVMEERHEVLDDSLGEPATVFVQISLAAVLQNPKAREGP